MCLMAMTPLVVDFLIIVDKVTTFYSSIVERNKVIEDFLFKIYCILKICCILIVLQIYKIFTHEMSFTFTEIYYRNVII